MSGEAKSAGAPGLVVDGVSKDYPGPRGTLNVLVDVSFDLAPGGAVAVVGPSGSGKSTLLNVIGSLEKPTTGEVTLDGVSVTALDGPAQAEFRSARVGFVFQDHHLLPQLTAAENVMLPMLAAGRKAEPERAAELLERVGLGERGASPPAELSGGERQRIAIARALANRPPLLLCDEPTGNLDSATGDVIGELFSKLAEEDGVMLVVVTHNMRLAERFGRVLRLADGSLEG